jgi:hypothetical protein
MELSKELRKKMIDAIAQKLTDNADLDMLMEFFYDAQYEYFDDLDDNEIVEKYEELEIE